MTGTNDRDLLHAAVHWLGRLPFLGVSDMSTLLSVGETRARQVLSELEGVGWCEWVATSSPELDERRLYVLTETAQNRLAESPQRNPLPIGRRETLARLSRLETTAGLNRFLSELATAAGEDIEVSLADARTLPWTAPRKKRFWPPDVQAYGCLRSPQWFAPFFVAWDRAAAPAAHRRKRVAGWYTYAESHRWETPPILVVCASEREAEQWARAVVISADRRGCPPLAVSLATAPAAQTDPMGEIWRRVDGRARAHLFERLAKAPSEKAPVQPSQHLDVDLDKIPTAQEPLRKWAIRVADHPHRASGFERVAALSLATGPLQKTMLEWISHHTLLTSSDLSALMDIRESLANKLLAGLEGRDLVRPLAQSEPAEPTASRYVLTSAGLRLLAARDGVPPRRYVRYGVIAAPNEGKTSRRLETLVGQFQHTTGANSFFVRLKRDVDAAGGRLLRWLNASESTVRFTYKEERRWLRPDGYAEFQLDGEVHRFFLEWDRGTTRHPQHLTEKFQNYADYFTTRAETDDVPALLVVTVSPHRETVIWGSLTRALGGKAPIGVVTTIDSLVHRLGPLCAIWRMVDSPRRIHWHSSGKRAAHGG